MSRKAERKTDRPWRKNLGNPYAFFLFRAAEGWTLFIYLKALEKFADAAFIITCPEGACRYFEGNHRANRNS